MTSIIDPFDKHYAVTIVHNLTGRKIVLGRREPFDLIAARRVMFGRIRPRLSSGMTLQQLGAVWFVYKGETLRYGFWITDTRLAAATGTDNAVDSTPVLDKDPNVGPYDECDLHPWCRKDCGMDGTTDYLLSDPWRTEQAMLNRLGVL